MEAKRAASLIFFGPTNTAASTKRSPGYPKKIAAEWKTSPPFNVNFDGVIIGQAANFGTKAYLFKTLSATVDNNTGNPVAVGALNSHPVVAPGYARYDFNGETTEFAVTSPAETVDNWNGLFPLLGREMVTGYFNNSEGPPHSYLCSELGMAADRMSCYR